MPWREAWPICHLFNLHFSCGVASLRKCLYRAQTVVWFAHTFLPKYAVLVSLLAHIPKPAACVFPSHPLLWEGCRASLPCKNMQSLRWCLVPGARVRKWPKTQQQKMKPKKLVMLMLSLKFLKLQVLQANPSDELVCVGDTSAVLKRLPHLLSSSGNGLRWCWMWNEPPSHSSWAMHIL